MNNVSYRMDAMSITFVPKPAVKDFKEAFSERGYELREPIDIDEVRIQKGYDRESALVLDIQIGEKEDDIFSLTVQVKNEKDGSQTGFLAVSGGQLDYVPYEDIARTYKDWVTGTRVDIAADIIYSSQEELDREHIRLCKKAGFDPKSGNYKHNPINDIVGGKKNPKTPISTASINASNGLTLYIGSATSKFRIRAYDKSAEVLKNVGVVMEPTLRIELVLRKEFAKGVVKALVDSDDAGHNLASTLWHTVSDNHIRFKKRVNIESLSELMGIDKMEVIEIDYSKKEGLKLEYEYWVSTSVSPKFNRNYGYLDLKEKILSLNRMGFFDPSEIEIMLTALIEAGNIKT